MPKLVGDDVTQQSSTMPGGFTFNATRISDLGATEYTLVTIAVDVTGSTYNFADELRQMLVTAVESCKKSPRSDNLLLRVIVFSTSVGSNGVKELHGFVPLQSIDTNAYPAFEPDGLTPLFDATYSAIGALVDYGKQLKDQDFLANGIVFIITDGGDNYSTATPDMIRQTIASVRQKEQLESLLSVLIGINDARLGRVLEDFKRDAGLDRYIAAGDVTDGALAKLAAFVSQSVSSQSQALGTGGPSQNIAAAI